MKVKNKRLVILIALLAVAIAIFICDKYANKALPIKLDAEKIETIEIVYDKPVIIEEPNPCTQLDDCVEYIEARKVSFDSGSFEEIPVYRYDDMIFTEDVDCFIRVGTDNGYYKFLSGRAVNPAFSIFAIFPTDAIRESEDKDYVYAVYDTDIGMRLYLFFSKAKNDYFRIDGFPIIMNEALEYHDFADLKIGDGSSEVQSIDSITSLYTQLWDEASDEWINIYIDKGTGPTSIHLLKDGMLKIEYKRIESGEYEITDMEYSEDFKLNGFDGETCYKISELDYPPEECGKSYIILNKEENSVEIAKLAELFNESVMHADQGIGTTHPTWVKIEYTNGEMISFWCGSQGFLTVSNDSGQYNYINRELDNCIAKLME